MLAAIVLILNPVHCRTGSLEMKELYKDEPDGVHCRTGSLESRQERALGISRGSLPHRQLRK